MDLSTENVNGRAWTGAKLGAFCCFAIAGALLVGSLILPPATTAPGETGLAASLASASR